MIQAILKDGKPHRFIGGIPKEWEDKILHQKELTEDEILQVPDTVEIEKQKKIVMRNHTKEEKDAQQAIKDADESEAARETLIQDKIKEQAIKELKKEGKI